ncbi:MAG: amino acid adenylation domain-containing protein, partial [Gammaproteobacteria bacterium]|nr:amino acid adenylation domain-containing protein [Gammaproteobacteria bacterium]
MTLKEAGIDLNLLDVIPKLPRTNEETLPLSFAQQRLWFLDQLVPNNPSYNIPLAVRLIGSLDIAVLSKCFNAVVARHEALRTVFVSHKGKPGQAIQSKLAIQLPVIDLSSLPEDERESQIRVLASADARNPFNLARGPLLRTSLIRLNAKENVLLLNMHHIVSDGWSMEILVRELGALYNAFSQNMPNPLPDLPIQYADFAHWQREKLQGEVLERQQSYWRQQLAGASEILELPTDRPYPATQSYRGSNIRVSISKKITEKLLKISHSHSATLFMVLTAAYQLLLSQYSGQKDICIGTPSANRNHSELEPLIGFFINTLVIRTQLDGNPSFSELLTQVRETTLDAFTHQDLPFEQLIDELQLSRTMRHAPLVQAIFALHTSQHGAVGASTDLQLEPIYAANPFTKVDLDLDLTETKNGLEGYIQFATDLFNEETVQRIADTFVQLLTNIADNPQKRLSEFNLLCETEAQQMLTEWNATERELPKKQCIHLLFEDQVAQTPNATAVVCDDQTVSYLELNTRANQLAHYLRKQGIGPDSLVGLCIDRSIEFFVAVLGILKAGGAYVPLDPDYPQERLISTLQDAKVKVLLTKSHLISSLPDIRTRVLNQLGYREILLDSQWSDIAEYSNNNPVNSTQPGNLAYIIYTSGTSGKPKGVLNHHSGLFNLVQAQTEGLNITSETRSLQFFSITFDGCVWEIFGTLLSGGTLYVANQSQRQSADAIVDMMKEHRIDLATLVPSVLKNLAKIHELPELKTLVLAGEACPRSLVEQWAPGRRLINAYGPTETTICVSMAQCNDTEQSPPIGKPIQNVTTYLLDAYLNPVPLGATGELYVGGAGLARGYLNDPQLTAEKFLPDPFSASPGARLYRTGDLARYLPDGNLDYRGRADQQVKLRGFRIELGDIEHVLRIHPAVAEATVVLREDQPNNKQLCAYLIPKAGIALPEATTLRDFVKAQLPDYMVPSTYTEIDAFPLTSSGKINLRALPQPEATAGQMFVAPQTATEQSLAKAWIEILKLERVGIHDNFFELGGHSLLATQLTSWVRDAFDVELPISAIFESATLAELAAHIEERQNSSQDIFVPPIVPVSRELQLPLSFSQQRLWFLDQLIPDSPFYNVPVVVSLHGALDIAA